MLLTVSSPQRLRLPIHDRFLTDDKNAVQPVPNTPATLRTEGTLPVKTGSVLIKTAATTPLEDGLSRYA